MLGGIRGVAAFGLAVLDGLVLKFSKRASLDDSKVLVVRLDGIGDFVLWLPAAAAIRAKYPAGKYQLVLLANQVWAELARDTGLFDQVWEIDRNRFLLQLSYRYQLLSRIRREGFSVALSPAHSREFLRGDAVIRFSGARDRVGAIGDCSNTPPRLLRVSEKWYSRLLDSGSSLEMELLRNARFVRQLGEESFQTTVPRLLQATAPPDSLIPKSYYILFPGGSKAGKRWPTSSWSEIANRMGQETGLTGVIAGSPDDIEMAGEIMKLAKAPLENWAGKTSIRELATLVGDARLVISGDTSCAHIAGAVDTPAVCVLGGWHYGRFHPYRWEIGDPGAIPRTAVYRMECFGCGGKCVHRVNRGDPYPCVSGIEVDVVWKEITVLLNDLGICEPSQPS